MNQTSQMPQEIPFEFKGTASQYFGIWIVNILLMIVTLGIYTAWAKVRTNRYFYGNTLLAGSPFGYLATPMAILKGWGIAVVVLIVYSVVTEFYPITGMIFFALFLIALPWIVVRAMSFRARNTTYRNIRFTFNASYGEAAKVFIGLTVLLPLTLGLIYPYYIYATNRFLVEHSGYGTTKFKFDAKFSDFYKVFLKLSLIVLLFFGLLMAAMFPTIKQYYEAAQQAAQAQQKMTEEMQQLQQQMQEEMAQYEQNMQQPEPEVMDEPAMDQQMPEQGDAALPEDTMQMMEGEGHFNADVPQSELDAYAQQDMEYAEGSGDLPNDAYSENAMTGQDAMQMDEPVEVDEVLKQTMEQTEAENMTMVPLITVVMLLAMFAFYLIPYAYIRARIQNLVYNHAELAGHRFRSSLRARDLTWLYFSNSLVIMLTLGLMIPWSKIRMARYRASKLVLLPAGDLDSFTQAEREQVSALGEEVGDVFDVDVGL
jgi:uncharacterized membrane protein YjgN (DUF898 family)